MQTSTYQIKRLRGQRLSTAEKMELTEKIRDAMEEGVMSTNAIAKKLEVNTTTIRRYRTYAEHMYNDLKLDRSFLRNLQIKRTMKQIERLTVALEACSSLKEELAIHDRIVKYYIYLSQIAGIANDNNVVPINNKQMVIIRPALVSAD